VAVKIVDGRYLVALALLLVLLESSALTDYVGAVPLLPCSFAGYVYINGSPAPINTEVRGSIDGVFYGSAKTTLSNGAYSLTVYGDDSATPTKEGGVNGDPIFFWVGNEIANEHAHFAEGGNEVLDLNVWTSMQPPFLKINELMPKPLSLPEWVELFNPALFPVSLAELSISDNDGYRYELAPWGTLPAKAFFLHEYPTSGYYLNDVGDEIKIDWYDETSGHYITIDRVEYGSGGIDETILSNAPVPGTGQSLVLLPDGEDTDDPATDFTISSTPTPGAANGSISIPGDVNSDGIVNDLDLIELNDAYGLTDEDPGWDPRCDLNNDKVVSVPDLYIVGENYGRTS
jgi:hypothetical protein